MECYLFAKQALKLSFSYAGIEGLVNGGWFDATDTIRNWAESIVATSLSKDMVRFIEVKSVCENCPPSHSQLNDTFYSLSSILECPRLASKLKDAMHDLEWAKAKRKHYEQKFSSANILFTAPSF